MQTLIDAGRKVQVHYIGSLADGSEFENTYKSGKPLEYIVGARQVVLGFDKAVASMQVGEKRNVQLSAVEGYGNYDVNLVEKVALSSFPAAERLPVGDYITIATSSGEMRVKVLRIKDGWIYFDHNHELAGRDLYFQIELLKVYGVSGSLIENERYMTGSCGCGCDEMRKALGHNHDCHAVAI
jgi:FKBP-type peptidyl-prolyl cis-trans isomerase 2